VLIAVLDDCVFYQVPLRDLMMRVAATEIYQPRWTDQIHEEWTRNVLKDRPDLSREQLERTRELMNNAIPDCLVSKYQGLIEGVSLPDIFDRHVLASAVRCQPQLIVTGNLRDFPAEVLSADEVEARHLVTF
jgi:hypothetical protein